MNLWFANKLCVICCSDSVWWGLFWLSLMGNEQEAAGGRQLTTFALEQLLLMRESVARDFPCEKFADVKAASRGSGSHSYKRARIHATPRRAAPLPLASSIQFFIFICRNALLDWWMKTPSNISSLNSSHREVSFHIPTSLLYKRTILRSNRVCTYARQTIECLE